MIFAVQFKSLQLKVNHPKSEVKICLSLSLKMMIINYSVQGIDINEPNRKYRSFHGKLFEILFYAKYNFQFLSLKFWVEHLQTTQNPTANLDSKHRSSNKKIFFSEFLAPNFEFNIQCNASKKQLSEMKIFIILKF